MATQKSILFYDTQQSSPFALISDVHYARLSDITWSKDGRLLMASSTDGYCTFVAFEDGELGTFYDGPIYSFEPVVEKMAEEDEAAVSADVESTDKGGDTPKPSKANKKTPEVLKNTPRIGGFFKHINKEEAEVQAIKMLNQLQPTTPLSSKRKDRADTISEIIEMVVNSAEKDVTQPTPKKMKEDKSLMTTPKSALVEVATNVTASEKPPAILQSAGDVKSFTSPSVLLVPTKKTAIASRGLIKDFEQMSTENDQQNEEASVEVKAKTPRRVSFITLTAPKRNA